HQLERVHLRLRPPQRPVEADDHGMALPVLRDQPPGRLGRPDGGLDSCGDPGSDLLWIRAEKDRVRADLGSGQRLMAESVLDRVTKEFDNGFVALDDVSLTVPVRQSRVLVGPCGCGQSTWLRMIAGLEEVTGGTVFIGGRDVTELAPRHRDIAMVFQNYALYPHMDVRRNLAYGLKVRKTSKDEIDQRVEEVAHLLGLEKLLDRKPAALSGGQRQRGAMGGAIEGDPAAVLR